MGRKKNSAVPDSVRVRDYLMDLIAKGGGGETKLPGTQTIAERFGVTRMTVYRATKDLVREGYLTVRPGIGLFLNPAKPRDQAGPAARLIGLVVGEGFVTQYNLYTWKRMVEIGNRFVAAGYHVKQVFLENLTAESAARRIGEMKLAGMIWIAPGAQGVDTIRRLVREGGAVVSVDQVIEDVCCVCRDEYREGVALGKLLLRRRCRHPLIASLLPHQKTIPPLDGLREVFGKAGIVLEDTRILHDPDTLVEEVARLLEAGLLVDAFWLTGGGFLREILGLLRRHQRTVAADCIVIAGQYPEPVRGFHGYIREHPYEQQAELVFRSFQQAAGCVSGLPRHTMLSFPLTHLA